MINASSWAPPCKPGESYVAEAKTGCHFDWPDRPEMVRTLHFSLSPETIEPPSSLGALRSVRHGPTVVAYGGGSACLYDLDSDAVDLMLDTSALPEAWRPLIGHYQLIVDGAPFAWPSTVGSDDSGPDDTARGFYFKEPGTFRAFTECEASDSSEQVGLPPGQRGLASGVHSVWVEARVPIAPARVIESERVEIELSCERAASAADAEVAGASGRAGIPAEPLPAGAVSGDASHVAEDEQQDAADGAVHTASTGGCSLRARGSAPGAVSGALVLLLLVTLIRWSVRARWPEKRSPSSRLPPASRRGWRLAALAALAGCQPEAHNARIEGIPADWVHHEAPCGMSFLGPETLIEMPVQGVDSCVLQFMDDDCTLSGGRGGYSSGLSAEGIGASGLAPALRTLEIEND